MKLWDAIKNLATSRAAAPRDPTPWIGKTTAGIYVDERNALSVSTVFGCVRAIAETLGALPWHTFERKVDTSGRATRQRRDDDVAWLLNTQPNPEITAQTFRETLLAHALLWGNGFAEIERDTSGRPVWLWPLTPDRVTPMRSAAGGLIYRVYNGAADYVELRASDVFHLKGLGWDGLAGYSVVRLAAQSLGLTLAMERHGQTFFGNGARPGAVLEHPGKLGPEGQSNLKNSFDESFKGNNAHNTMVLEEGMKWHPMTVPPEDSQFLESREFQVAEICRWFRVPPHMVADLKRATFSNIEQQSIEFVQQALMPWAVRLESEANIKLYGRINRGVVYTKIALQALVRGDLKSRYEAYNIGRNGGWLSADDVRELEDMNPVPGGDIYLAPLNMVPADKFRDIVEAQNTPAAADPSPQPDATPAPKPAGLRAI